MRVLVIWLMGHASVFLSGVLLGKLFWDRLGLNGVQSFKRYRLRTADIPPQQRWYKFIGAKECQRDIPELSKRQCSALDLASY